MSLPKDPAELEGRLLETVDVLRQIAAAIQELVAMPPNPNGYRAQLRLLGNIASNTARDAVAS